MAKRITFISPGPGREPIGGHKVVYEYANALVARGHSVTVVLPARCRRDYGFWQSVRSDVEFWRSLVNRSYGPRLWFSLDPRVRVLWVRTLAERFIPDADIVIATAWRTAEWVAGYGSRKGTKYYLIQHFEDWSGDAEEVLTTWALPLRKIVIAKWLGEIADRLGERYAYVPNGLDFSRFGVDVPIEARDPSHLMMLYHNAPWKGCKEGLHAMDLIREQRPELRVTMFGVPDGDALPQWVNYCRTPTQSKLRSLYNAAAIFVAPAWTEGWGLPACEAMMCGAAVVATDIGGHHEFAHDGSTALLAAPKDPRALADKILMLIEHPERRIELARAGNKNVRQFSWQRACDSLEKALSTDSSW